MRNILHTLVVDYHQVVLMTFLNLSDASDTVDFS